MLMHFKSRKDLGIEKLFTFTLSMTQMSTFNLACLFGASRIVKLLVQVGALEIQKRHNLDRNWFGDGPLKLCLASERLTFDVIQVIFDAIVKVSIESGDADVSKYLMMRIRMSMMQMKKCRATFYLITIPSA